MGVGKGDFMGFQYGGYHSSQLGITRVSDGSRYTEELAPTINDKIIEKPGNDGTYFFGSFFTQKTFDLSMAFDSITEAQLYLLRMIFSTKVPQQLIFDETPYKFYWAKPAAAPQFNYVCFEEGDKLRVYKGECTVSLVSYDVYAHSTKKTLTEFDDENVAEWSDVIALKQTLDGIDTFGGNPLMAELWNPGEVETDWTLSLKGFSADTVDDTGSIQKGTLGASSGFHIYLTDDADSQLYLSQIVRIGLDDEVRINSATNLIEGYKDGKRTGNLYNRHKTKGTFFKIPTGQSYMTITGITNAAQVGIDYDYLFY